MNAQKEHFRIICEFNDAQDDKKRLPPSYKAVEYARGEIADLQAQVAALEGRLKTLRKHAEQDDHWGAYYIPLDSEEPLIALHGENWLHPPTASEGVVPVSGRIVGGEPIYDQIGVAEPEGVE